MSRDEAKREAEYLFKQLRDNFTNEKERNYWQGRVDGLAWAMNRLEIDSILIEG